MQNAHLVLAVYEPESHRQRLRVHFVRVRPRPLPEHRIHQKNQIAFIHFTRQKGQNHQGRALDSTAQGGADQVQAPGDPRRHDAQPVPPLRRPDHSALPVPEGDPAQQELRGECRGSNERSKGKKSGPRV